MAYADYKFYSEVFHGTMSEADFARFAEPASAYIDAATFDRITPELLADENIGGVPAAPALMICIHAAGRQM